MFLHITEYSLSYAGGSGKILINTNCITNIKTYSEGEYIINMSPGNNPIIKEEDYQRILKAVEQEGKFFK